MKLLLFDIDGTLLRGHGAGGRAMRRAGQALFGEHFSLQGITISGGLDPVIFRAAARALELEGNDEQHAAFRERYLAELSDEVQKARPAPSVLPGVQALLATLRARADLTLGLVTGNYQRAVPIKLGAVGIDLTQFKLGAFADDADTRPAMVALALSRFTRQLGRVLDPAHAIVIGDTPRDVDCAQKNGCACLAVATGIHPREELEAAGADYVLDDLTDPVELFAWIEGT